MARVPGVERGLALASQVSTVVPAGWLDFAWNPCGEAPNKRINLMRPSAQIHWKRTAHRLCATRWTHWSR